jgi:hypothetical protein
MHGNGRQTATNGIGAEQGLLTILADDAGLLCALRLQDKRDTFVAWSRNCSFQPD